MEIGIKGSATLQVTDRISNEVTTIECCNLITNYGLERFLGPKNLRETVVTHMCFGYRSTEASVDDDHIPSNYIFVPITTEDCKYIDGSTARGTWTIPSNALDNIEIGTTINHITLAYCDPDGIFYPLTSLLLKDTSGELFEYVHSSTTRLTAVYSVILNISSTVISSDYKSVGISDYQVQLPGVYLREMREENAYYENQPNLSYLTPASIRESTGSALGDGTWVQKYIIGVTSYTYAGSFELKIGFAIFKFVPTNYRVTATYELELTVKQPLPELLTPRAATAIVISPPTYINTEEDQRRLKISVPPYQWIDIYCNGYFIASEYIGPLGYTYRSSYVINGYDADGTPVPLNEFLLSKGNRVRIVSRTLAGSTEVYLKTPDVQADNCIAIWWHDENTIRVVSRINDTVKLLWHVDPFRDTNYASKANMVYSGKSVVCNTLYDEVKDYYYGDIDMSDYVQKDNYFLCYTVTDEAGNVFNDLYADYQGYIRNYVPGQSYEQCIAYAKNRGITVSDDDNTFLPAVNKYSFSLRLLSAEIK